MMTANEEIYIDLIIGYAIRAIFNDLEGFRCGVTGPDGEKWKIEDSIICLSHQQFEELKKKWCKKVSE